MKFDTQEVLNAILKKRLQHEGYAAEYRAKFELPWWKQFGSRRVNFDLYEYNRARARDYCKLFDFYNRDVDIDFKLACELNLVGQDCR